MKPFRPLLFLSLALAASAAPLTLDEALARAAASHPRLLALGAREEAAAALVEQAALRPNPELSVSLENFAGTGTARGLDALEGTVALSQSIERGDKRALRRTAAGEARATLAAETAVTRAEIHAATARAYVAAVAAAQRVNFAEDFVALARTALEHAEKRRAAGDASAVEPARARATLAAAEAEAARQVAALQSARAALAALWEGDDAVPAATSLHLPDTLPDFSGWSAQSDHLPQLRLTATRAEAARARAGLEQANATPNFTVSGGLRYLREDSDAALVAGFSVPLPVRHRNQGAVRAARQEVAAAEHETAAVARELRREAALAARELAATHAAALRLRREVLPAAEEAASLLHRAYAAGQATQLEVLEAERTHREVHRELLDQEAAFAAALVRVEALFNPALPLTRQLLATP
jgi:cobalt-zinc-cadmium efflux system outer membrane protein